jgi:hypothetical protein
MKPKNLFSLIILSSQFSFFALSVYSQSPVHQSLLNVDFGIGSSSAKVGPAAVGQSATDFWNLYSRDDGNGGYRTFGEVDNLVWADGTESSVDLTVENAPGAWINGLDDPMYNVYIYPFNSGDITVTVSSLPTGWYDIYLYGHGGPGADSLNAIFEVEAGGTSYGTKATTTGPDWISSTWQEGVQYVVFRGVSIGRSNPAVTIISHPGAYGLAVINGMQVLASKPTPPAQPPAPTAPAKPVNGSLLNVDFGIGTTSSKVGAAAVGKTASDYWNLYSRDDGFGGYRTFGEVDNLKWFDGSVSSVDLTVANAPGAWINGLEDPMYDIYLYPFDGGNIAVTVTDLPAGQYDFYLYGHGGPGVDSLNAVFELEAGGQNYGSQATTTGADWSSATWQEGRQYIVFRGVLIGGTHPPVTITVHPGDYGLAVINGMQAVRDPGSN